MGTLGKLVFRSAAGRPKNAYSRYPRGTFAQGLHLGHTLAQPWSKQPPPQEYCTQGLTKNEFSQDTHLPCTVPTWPLYNTHGVTPLAFAPVSGNEALPDAPKTPILGTPGALSPKVSIKTSFPWVPTRRVEYPRGPSTTPTGSQP